MINISKMGDVERNKLSRELILLSYRFLWNVEQVKEKLMNLSYIRKNLGSVGE